MQLFPWALHVLALLLIKKCQEVFFVFTAQKNCVFIGFKTLNSIKLRCSSPNIKRYFFLHFFKQNTFLNKILARNICLYKEFMNRISLGYEMVMPDKGRLMYKIDLISTLQKNMTTHVQLNSSSSVSTMQLMTRSSYWWPNTCCSYRVKCRKSALSENRGTWDWTKHLLSEKFTPRNTDTLHFIITVIAFKNYGAHTVLC